MQSFLVKHQITHVTRPPYSLDLVSWNFWIFPKLKSPLKGKRFQTVNEIQENMMGQLMAIERTVWGHKVPGDWGIIVPHTMFPVSCIFFNKCLYFSYCFAGYFLKRPKHTQSGAKVGLQSLFLYYYLLIILLFFIWTTVNLLLPHSLCQKLTLEFLIINESDLNL